MNASTSPRLDVIQRWMQSVIVHSEGVEAGIESAAAQGMIAVRPGQIEELICRSRGQSSIERLEVYSNAYRARLLEVLIGEYPALVEALGEEAFVGLASGYLDVHPPSSYTLGDLGRSFAEHLALSRPANQNQDGTPDWADFLIDLARLERIYSEVFDGPGIEGHSILQPDDVRHLSPEQWHGACLIPAPCLRLESFRFPVHEYATAIRHHQEPVVPATQQTRLAITRREFIVRRVELAEAEFAALSVLIEGRSVGEALEWAFKGSLSPADALAAEIGHWFRNWAAASYFVGLRAS